MDIMNELMSIGRTKHELIASVKPRARVLPVENLFSTSFIFLNFFFLKYRFRFPFYFSVERFGDYFRERKSSGFSAIL